MEDKKSIKLSLSTCFLIVAIIIICIMGLVIYRQTNKNLNTEINTKNTTSSDLSETQSNDTISNITTNNTLIENSTTTSNVYSYNDIKGIYTYSQKLNDEENAFYNLCLFENGTFYYSFGISNEKGFIGNYIIVDDEVVMNKMFSTGSDASLTAIEGSLKLKINSDNSLNDSNQVLNVDKVFASKLSNINLKKSTNKDDLELYYNINISKMLKNYNLENDYKE